MSPTAVVLGCRGPSFSCTCTFYYAVLARFSFFFPRYCTGAGNETSTWGNPKPLRTPLTSDATSVITCMFALLLLMMRSSLQYVAGAQVWVALLCCFHLQHIGGIREKLVNKRRMKIYEVILQFCIFQELNWIQILQEWYKWSNETLFVCVWKPLAGSILKKKNSLSFLIKFDVVQIMQHLHFCKVCLLFNPYSVK